MADIHVQISIDAAVFLAELRLLIYLAQVIQWDMTGETLNYCGA
jgi:hypothetical protein